MENRASRFMPKQDRSVQVILDGQTDAMDEGVWI